MSELSELLFFLCENDSVRNYPEGAVHMRNRPVVGILQRETVCMWKGLVLHSVQQHSARNQVFFCGRDQQIFGLILVWVEASSA